MNTVEKKSWEEVRQRGRNRFLLRSIGRASWMFAIAFPVMGVALFVFAKRPLQPWDWLAEWAVMSVVIGAVWGLLDWEEKEKQYRESDKDGEGH